MLATKEGAEEEDEEEMTEAADADDLPVAGVGAFRVGTLEDDEEEKEDEEDAAAETVRMIRGDRDSGCGPRGGCIDS